MRIIALALVLAMGHASARENELVAAKVAKGPKIDGLPDDECWKSAKELTVKVDLPINRDAPKESITLKAVHDGEFVYFLLTWKDSTESRTHYPWVWSKEKNAYEEPFTPDDDDVQDMATLGFELKGEFNPDMLAGIESEWDVWVWEAARTDPVGYARNMRHVYTLRKPKEGKFAKRKTEDGRDVFIGRIDHPGKKPFVELEAPKAYTTDKVARFKSQEPEGEAAEVRAKGTWEKGVWRVEFARKLKTGHDDETQFDLNKSYAFAVATFDHCESMGHSVSSALKLTFQK